MVTAILFFDDALLGGFLPFDERVGNATLVVAFCTCFLFI